MIRIWHEELFRLKDRTAVARREALGDLLTEVDRLRAELAQRDKDLEPYEALNPQQCPAGQHLGWLVDSEYTHACPWCRIAELEQLLAASQSTAKQLLRKVASAPSQREAGAA